MFSYFKHSLFLIVLIASFTAFLLLPQIVVAGGEDIREAKLEGMHCVSDSDRSNRLRSFPKKGTSCSMLIDASCLATPDRSYRIAFRHSRSRRWVMIGNVVVTKNCDSPGALADGMKRIRFPIKTSGEIRLLIRDEAGLYWGSFRINDGLLWRSAIVRVE